MMTGNRGVLPADERDVDRPPIANLDNVVQFFRILLEWDKKRPDSSIASPAHEGRPDGSAVDVLVDGRSDAELEAIPTAMTTLHPKRSTPV
jgi:hypothetical protein